MNSTFKLPPKKRASWAWISLSAAAVSAVALLLSVWFLLPPLGILIALYLFGTLAGSLAGRHGWLSGTIVGLPFGLAQLTSHALQEFHTLSAVLAQRDYWLVAVPTAALATGVAILGGMSGAWFRGTRRTQ